MEELFISTTEESTIEPKFSEQHAHCVFMAPHSPANNDQTVKREVNYNNLKRLKKDIGRKGPDL